MCYESQPCPSSPSRLIDIPPCFPRHTGGCSWSSPWCWSRIGVSVSWRPHWSCRTRAAWTATSSGTLSRTRRTGCYWTCLGRPVRPSWGPTRPWSGNPSRSWSVGGTRKKPCNNNNTNMTKYSTHRTISRSDFNNFYNNKIIIL